MARVGQSDVRARAKSLAVLGVAPFNLVRDKVSLTLFPSSKSRPVPANVVEHLLADGVFTGGRGSSRANDGRFGWLGCFACLVRVEQHEGSGRFIIRVVAGFIVGDVDGVWVERYVNDDAHTRALDFLDDVFLLMSSGNVVVVSEDDVGIRRGSSVTHEMASTTGGAAAVGGQAIKLICDPALRHKPSNASLCFLRGDGVHHARQSGAAVSITSAPTVRKPSDGKDFEGAAPYDTSRDRMHAGASANVAVHIRGLSTLPTMILLLRHSMVG